MTHDRLSTHWRPLAWLAALALLLPGALAAQQVINGVPVGPDGEPLANPPSRRLSANRDVAYSDLRSAGYFNRVCAETLTAMADPDHPRCALAFQTMNNGFVAVWLRQGDWAWAASPTDWQNAVAKVPSLANAIGGGWTVSVHEQTGFDDTDAADNSLGLHHAGLTSTSDLSCLDHSTTMGAGNPVLAGSNCAQTWGSEPASPVRDPNNAGRGWGGMRRVPVEVYHQRFAMNEEPAAARDGAVADVA